MIDYQELLRKYIQHVVAEEGWSYLCNIRGSDVYFSEEQIQALTEIEKQLDLDD